MHVKNALFCALSSAAMEDCFLVSSLEFGSMSSLQGFY